MNPVQLDKESPKGLQMADTRLYESVTMVLLGYTQIGMVSNYKFVEFKKAFTQIETKKKCHACPTMTSRQAGNQLAQFFIRNDTPTIYTA